jgi:hypothetical protein
MKFELTAVFRRFPEGYAAFVEEFQKQNPGVKVNWADHQGTFKDDLNNAFNAGTAPDVINLSVSEGWVSEYADKGVLLPLDDKVPAAVKDIYLPGLWKEQLINGVNFQFPWYQGLNVERYHIPPTKHYMDLVIQGAYQHGVSIMWISYLQSFSTQAARKPRPPGASKTLPARDAGADPHAALAGRRLTDPAPVMPKIQLRRDRGTRVQSC